MVLCFNTEVSVALGEWVTYVVVVGPDGDHRVYLDGERVPIHYNAGTGPTSHGFFASVPVDGVAYVGYGDFGVTGRWWHFPGAVAEVAVYDRPLTDAEVQALTP